MNIVKRTNGLMTALAVLVGAVAVGLVGVPAAQAATQQNGVCEAGELCYYWGASESGSVSDFVPAGSFGSSATPYGSKPNYRIVSSTLMYVFQGSGLGKGSSILHNAASIWNRTSMGVRICTGSDYSGTCVNYEAGYKGNLATSVANSNSSHLFYPSGTKPATSTGAVILDAAQWVVNQKVPYVWGGGHASTPGPSVGTSKETGVSKATADAYWAHDKVTKGLDCSGFVRYVYYLAGVTTLPSGFIAKTPTLTPTHWTKLGTTSGSARAGDVVVMSSGGHIGIYDGNGKIYEEPGHTYPTTWGYATHSRTPVSVVAYYRYK